jgi:prolyl-tRNA editing enzyme YbaK/EbsC (Cys-tRNA(Pro) deacylase)
MFDQFRPEPAIDRPDLLAPATLDAVRTYLPTAQVFQIDPDLSDTEALCTAFDLPMDIMGNAVLVAGKREGVQRQACCMVLGSRRVDVNNVVRKRLDVHKASFMPMDDAVASSGMEYGGITPVGLGPAWPIWLDDTIASLPTLVIGSGVRRSKLILTGADLLSLPTAELVDDLTRAIG